MPVTGSKNRMRFKDARLHAVSSRNMYSEQGLLALIRPSSGQVCHSLMVVSNCTPGSAQDQAATAMVSHRSEARSVRTVLLVVRLVSFHSSSRSIASMKLLGMRTELLLFWPATLE